METLKPKTLSSNEKIEQMKKATCVFPIIGENGRRMCGKKQSMTVSLPLLSRGETGIIVHESAQMGAPFCKYHCFLAMSEMFGVMNEGNGKTSLFGNFEAVDLIETVILAQIMSGKLQESLKAVEKAEQQLNEMKKKEEEKNETIE